MIGQKQLSAQPTIHNDCTLHNVTLGTWTEVGPYNVWDNVVFGDFSYTSGFNQLQNAVVGKFVNIAAMVRIGAVQHPLDRPTLHHFTYRRQLYGLADEDDAEFFAWRQAQKVEIGHDVWLGHNAIILPGVTVGHGAVVGSGAVVTRDVAPYAIVGGVPALFIRERLPTAIAQKMQEIKWWDWEYELIKERFQDFLLTPEEFVTKHGTVR
ncbi:MAG: Chloramphenicol acetyltransferase [Firmicutes bacterium]|nr:Chloramphenicol acetyltransferase [Bacillota bacterium]